MGESSNELLNEARTMHSSKGRTKGAVVPKHEIETGEAAMQSAIFIGKVLCYRYIQIVEALPFVLREQLTEFGIPKGNSLGIKIERQSKNFSIKLVRLTS